MPASAEYVHRLLQFLAAHGWAHAPKVLGIDDRGREILAYIEGEVPWSLDRQAAVRSDTALARLAELLRELHDLTVGTDFAGDEEVACHNDLSPKNTVYCDSGAGLVPVAFLDWDNAAPGRRIDDVAHLCWQFVGLGRDATPPAIAAARVRLVADAYGLDDRLQLISAILEWQDKCWEGIEARADAGDAAMRRLRAAGGVSEVCREHGWTLSHRADLELALR